ncbi:hypothetical protein [Luteibaculum oceani]|uniref:Tetratricopeptide repeat protein n=1 Tax=Luteibaculum oceani TaxID=1294296 RepID=A0A5C6V8G8_9FLAO|nr:hypothetical protein [Luteibaculum oceani]TXC81663.1 hypothetical protein FRX97_03870 [Luteibaculum oceani]
MKQRASFLRALTLLIFTLYSFATYAQSDRIYVYGTVKDERSSKKLTDVKVILVEDGNTKTTYVTTLNGKFELDLDFDHDYDIRFVKDGYVAKFININTKNVPDENKVGGFGFDLDMSLFEEIDGINFDILKKPIGKASFVPAAGELGFDFEYTRSIQAEIARLKRELEKRYKEEEERLRREQEEAERQRKILEQFDQLVIQGDQEYANAAYMNAVFKYSDALDLYNQNSSFITGGQIVEQKLAKAKAALEEQQKQAELEQNYKKLISEADDLVAQEKWQEAKNKYESALALKPQEAYPQQQINSLNRKLEDLKKQKELEENYKKLVAEGDQLFQGEKFTEAIAKYEGALKLKPQESYPANQINAAQAALSKLEEQRKIQEQYDNLIASADNSFNNKKYEDAIGLYTEALKLKSQEAYPKDQIEKARAALQQLEDQAKLNEKYDKFVQAGDKAFGSEQFEEAIAQFTSASELKPEEQYPKEQIAAAKKAIADRKAQEELNKKYNDLIVDGDANIKAEKYNEAIASYTEALKVKPNEQYPKDQIAAAKEAIAQKEAQQAAEEKYNALIASADQKFGEQNYQAAITDYSAALAIKGNEQYPSEQIAKAEKALADAKAKDENYQKLITQADVEFNQAKFEQAIASYEKALGIKPNEQYPKDQITKAKAELEAIKQQEKLDDAYQNALAAADKSFGDEKYQEAIANYNKALGIKPDEQYPKDQIALANGKIKEAQEKQALLNQYQEIIAAADQAFTAKEYNAAIAKYQEALQLNPNEQYPKDQIGKAQAALDALEKQKEQEALYNKLVAEGDEAMGNKAYDNAIAKFQEALGIKPNETYPKDKIAEANKLKAEAQKAQELEANYQKLIAQADTEFKGKRYNEAINTYNNALGIKPNEQYPKDQIKKAEAALDELAKRQELEQEYQGLISEADGFFDDKKYSEAISKYEAAMQLKPQEQYPKQQIEKANEALDAIARAKERTEKYNQLIVAADQKFDNGSFEEAVADYQKALQIKPDEQYPKDQIAAAQKEIEAKLAAKELEQQYATLLQKGDVKLDSNRFDEAISNYQKALTLKPGEKYPKDQIAAAQKAKVVFEKQQELRKQYQGFISEGDANMKKEKYQQAIANYQDALTLIPGEQYPKDQIAKAKKALEDIKLAYEEAVKAGDSKMQADDWENAIKDYEKALTIYPNEQYPKDQIAKANILIEKSKEPKVVAFQDITKFGEVNKDSIKAEAAKELAAKEKEAPKEEVNPEPKVMYKTTSTGDENDFRKLLGDNYPEGITREKYKDVGKDIFRIIYVEGGFGDELLRIVARFGTFYFKNGSSISSQEYNSFLDKIGASASNN